jgi:hypothetical protein
MNPSSLSHPSPRPKRWKAIGLLLLLFVVGIVTGVGGLAIVVRHKLQVQMANGTVGTVVVDRLEKELISKLDLSPSEEAAIRPEFDITRREVRLHRQRMLESLRETSRGTVQRLKSKLPPEKQELLEKVAHKRLGPWGLLR